MASVIDAFRTVLGARHAMLKIATLSVIASYPIFQVVTNWGDWTSSWAIVAYAVLLFYFGYIFVASHNLINEEDIVLPGFLNPFKFLFAGIGAVFALVPMIVIAGYVCYCLYMIGVNKGLPLAATITVVSLVGLLFWGFLMVQMTLFTNKYNPLHSYKLISLFKSFSSFVGKTIPLLLMLAIVTAVIFYPFGYLAHMMFYENDYQYVFYLVVIFFVTLSLLIITQYYSQMFMENLVLYRKLDYEDDAGKIMDKQLLLDEDNNNQGRGY